MYVRDPEGFGLSTNAGMSLQRVEGVNEGCSVVGSAHRRRWQIGNESRGGVRGACVCGKMGKPGKEDLCPLMLLVPWFPTRFFGKLCGRLRLSDKYQHIRRRQKDNKEYP